MVELLNLPLVTAIANVIGIWGAITATLAWWHLRREKQRSTELITVRLEADGVKYYDLPAQIQRGELTRAELQGRLGIIPKVDKKQTRYFIEHTNKPEYIEDIYGIANGRDTLLRIKCTEEEFKQFDIADEIKTRPS